MELKDFINKNRLGEFQLLRDFVSRGLHAEAVKACDSAINTCETRISKLRELKELIRREYERLDSV
jgi:hypothetical protein